jgi:hypothetical protein
MSSQAQYAVARTFYCHIATETGCISLKKVLSVIVAPARPA